MIKIPGKRTKLLATDITIPDRTAPLMKEAHNCALMRARYRCVSHGPSEASTGVLLSASARWLPILLSVPVTKVKLTASAPIWDRAGLSIPVPKLSKAILTLLNRSS